MRSLLQRVAFALALTAALIVNVWPAHAADEASAVRAGPASALPVR